MGFGWHPGSGGLFATNNGPDHLGFEQPPEHFAELSAGSFHGMPWYQWMNGEVVRDNCIDSEPPRAMEEVVTPNVTFLSRSAPLGMDFVPDSAAGDMAGNAVIAIHGSWGMRQDENGDDDPDSKRPPKLSVVTFSDGRPVAAHDLLTGFQLPGGSRWARPAGVAVHPNGDIYWTSDAAAMGVYRLRRL